MISRVPSLAEFLVLGFDAEEKNADTTDNAPRSYTCILRTQLPSRLICKKSRRTEDRPPRD
jgi:hypothetical protein